MVGKALLRKIDKKYIKILKPTSKELDLMDRIKKKNILVNLNLLI